MAQRIKGQETELVLLLNGQPVDSFTDIKSANVSFAMEIKEQGFLGETANRYDSVFNGVSGDLDMEFSTPDVFKVITSLVDKARRRLPGTTVNIKMTFNFPSGRRARVVFPSVEFGEIPLGVGGRADYNTLKLSFKGSSYSVI
jgi:hypothetical protein